MSKPTLAEGLTRETLRHWRAVFTSLDFVAAMAAVVTVLLFVSEDQLAQRAPGVWTAEAAMASALLGVVVAALAVVVVFLDDEFLAFLDKANAEQGGIAAHLFPFRFVAGTGVWAILMSLTGLLSDGYVIPVVAYLLLAGSTGLTVWTLFGVLNLVSYMKAIGGAKARHLSVRKRGPTHGDPPRPG